MVYWFIDRGYDLKGYLINIVAHYNIAAGLMPAFLFVVGAFIGFSTGSSWGVWL